MDLIYTKDSFIFEKKFLFHDEFPINLSLCKILNLTILFENFLAL